MKPLDKTGRWRIRMAAGVAAVALLAVFALIGLMIWKAAPIAAFALTDKLYTVLLILLGVMVGVALFGVVQSSATYRGEKFGGILRLGGPITACMMIIGVGLVAVPKPKEFSLTVYAHPADRPQDLAAANAGDIVIDFGDLRRKERIGERGEAYFSGIPGSFQGRPLLVDIDSDTFEAVQPGVKLSAIDGAIYLPVRRKVGRVHGYVQSDLPACVTQARIEVGGILANVKPESGYFEVVVPGQRMQRELILRANAPGCESREYTVYPDADGVTISLRPVSG